MAHFRNAQGFLHTGEEIATIGEGVGGWEGGGEVGHSPQVLPHESSECH